MNIVPPDIHERWDDNNAWQQAHILAYNFIRSYEESES